MVDLCLIVPHPDDEVFGAGGMFRRMSQHGRRVATITLTRGGAGRTLGLCPREELPAKREQELRNSLRILGVAEDDTFIFDYPDFVTAVDRGMDRREGLRGVDQAELTGEVSKLLRRLRPRSVLTFPPSGSNGHPDHVTTHRVVMSALQQIEEAPENLYYFASERPYAGQQPEGFLPAQDIIDLHLPPTHYVKLDQELEAKLRAMGQHETQARSVMNFMRWAANRLMVETFHRAIPAPVSEFDTQTVYWI